MLPLALALIVAGWFDLPPRPAQLPAIAVREMTRVELLERRRAGRASRRRRQALRAAAAAIAQA